MKKLAGLVKLNRLNSKDGTALDVVNKEIALDLAGNREIVVDVAIREEMKALLEGKGAKTRGEIFTPETTTKYVRSSYNTFLENISRAFYYLSAEMTLEMRNTILVVATLIVAGTYQGVLQPPGGVYPPSPSNAMITSSTHEETPLTSQYHMGRRLGGSSQKQPEAGQMVMEKAYYRFFMPSNSFAFALSTVIVIFVVPGTPVFFLLHLCLVFMCVSYLLALDAISYYTGISHKIFYMALYAIVGAYIVKLLYYLFKALLIRDDWWLHFLNVAFANYSTSVTNVYTRAILHKLYKFKKQYMMLRLPSTK